MKDGRVIRFNHPSWTRTSHGDYQDFVTVDGLQRLTAVRRFLKNEIPWCDGGCFLDEFEDKVLLLRHYYLTFSINSLKTREEVLQWYLQINDLGTPHSDQELSRVKELLAIERQGGRA